MPSSFEEHFENYKKRKDIKTVSKSKFKKTFENLQVEKLKEKILIDELLQVSIDNNDEEVIKNLQNCYNILTVKNEKLTVDGIMGKKTIKAVNEYKNPLELYVWFNMNHFNNLNKDRISNEFMREWINDSVIKNIKSFFENKED